MDTATWTIADDADRMGAAVYLDYVDDFLLDNTLIADNRTHEPTAPVLDLFAEGLVLHECDGGGNAYDIKNCTFVNNASYEGLTVEVASPDFRDVTGTADLAMKNTFIQGMSQFPLGSIYCDGGIGTPPVADSYYFITEVPATPALVSQGQNDYRPQFVGRLQDKGQQNLQDLDWDLTCRNIGWTPTLPEQSSIPVTVIDGTATIKEGWYEIDDEFIHLASEKIVIEPGVVIRVINDGTLMLEACESITIGDAERKGRVVFVGADRIQVDGRLSGNQFHFYGGSEEEPAELITHGLTVNLPLEYGLSFKNIDLNLVGSESLEEQNFEILNSAKQYMQIYSGCQGKFDGIRFDGVGTTQWEITNPEAGLGSFQVSDSYAEFSGCHFGVASQEAYFDLQILGVPSAGATAAVLDHCWFRGVGPQQHTQLVLGLTSVNLSGCQLLDVVEDYAIQAINSRTDMGFDHGWNTISREDDIQAPLIDLINGELILEAGENCFIHPQYSHDPFDGFITSNLGSQNPPADGVIWSGNYWGASESNGIALWEDLWLHVPQWVNAMVPADFLDECGEFGQGMIPPSTSDKIMFLDGEAAYLIGNYSGASSHWFQLLETYPKSSYSTSASKSLKSSAVHTTWGRQNAAALHSQMFSVSQNTLAHNPHLGVEQEAYAWVIEARWGDRTVALAALSGMLTTYTDPTDQLVINILIAEVGTYPPVGQSSSFASSRNRITNQAQAHRAMALLAAGEAAETEESLAPATRATSFQLGLAVPNPFNPVTHVPVVLTQDSYIKAALYDISGARVRTVVDQTLPAGSHRFRVDGSHLASGVYFLHVAPQNGAPQTAKLLLLK